MIIRILSEGQFDVADDAVGGLNELDGRLEAAIEAGDEAAAAAALADLLAKVREVGGEVPLDALVPSDLVLPAAGTSLAEMRDLVSGDGLIPG